MRLLHLLFFLFLATTLSAEKINQPFHFDPADETIAATVLENPLRYDAGIAPTTNGLWVTWLEYIPGQGDQLWIGLRQNEKWTFQKPLAEKPGDYANPTLTMDATDRLWLTYETSANTNWQVLACHQPFGKTTNATFTAPRPIWFGGSQINHRATPLPGSGIAVVCQQAVLFNLTGDQAFAARVAFLQTNSIDAHFIQAGSLEQQQWRPSIARSWDGNFHLLWDEYDGESFNVVLLTSDFQKIPPHQVKHLKKRAIATAPAWEARAQIVSDKNGKLYVSWEEDGENWGRHYLARLAGDKKSTRLADHEGPLHRFRKLHFAQLDEKTFQLKEYELPQPSFALATSRPNRPAGLSNFGVFYENSQIVVDGQNRPWIIYRHVYVPWIGLVPATHQQENLKIYARCLLPGGWSKLYTFSEGQGDGLQRIHVAPTTHGIAVAYTIGRTDRRQKDDPENEQHRGVALAEIRLEKAAVKVPAKFSVRSLSENKKSPSVPPRSRPFVEVASQKYELFFGDLHRHTDITLCFSPCDGTIEDAYRYAIDVAPLDFLAITDHTHDLAWGDGQSLIWHRSRKEVDRHALAGRFIPFYAYERSRSDTDHNVISLRGDILKPHTYPLSQFWGEIGSDTFTIPHQPFNAITWNYKDDAHRPLLEIYQGFRDAAQEEAALQGLRRGHHVGFIAASDHLSTGASFAGVWAEKPNRESVFRAMQARRTYAATAKIQLQVTCGEHWMGESFTVEKLPAIKVVIKGTAAIAKVDFFVDGVLQSSTVDLVQSLNHDVNWEAPANQSLTGPHIFHVRVTQSDGHRAWSSPLWVDIKK